MPTVNGLEFVERLLGINNTENLTVAIVSGVEHPEKVNKILNHQLVDFFFEKPIPAEGLKKLLHCKPLYKATKAS